MIDRFRREVAGLWLGLTHFDLNSKAEPARVKRWLKRFALMKRGAVLKIRACSQAESREAAISEFHRCLRREVRGLGNSRPHWYVQVHDDGLWKRLDSSLHAMIRSVHRFASRPAPTGRRLPSIHGLIAIRRERLSAPQNADKGQCANSPAAQGITPINGK
jgi:hypothetical protein